MSGQYMRASPEDVDDSIVACLKALYIARACDQLEVHPDASGAIRFLEAFIDNLEQIGGASGDKAGASGRTLQ